MVEVIVVKICPLPTCCITVAWNTFLQFVSPRAEKEMNEAKVVQEIGKGAAGEDGYEGEEGDGGPRSDVGATAVLWRGTTGPIDTAAGGGCHVRARGLARGKRRVQGGRAGTTAGKTVDGVAGAAGVRWCESERRTRVKGQGGWDVAGVAVGVPPRADHRRPSRRGWRHDRRHPLRVAWLLSASPNVRPTLCAESACGGALCHNVIGLVVLLRVPIVVDFVGPVKKKETSGRERVQCVRDNGQGWDALSVSSEENRTASSTFPSTCDEPLALPSGPIVPLS